MRHAILIALLSVAAILAGCQGKSGKTPNPAAVSGSEESAPAAAAEAPKPADPAPQKAADSPNAAVRDGIRAWSELASKCSTKWFSNVDPSRLDKWELPIDVTSMEGECDKLIFAHEDLEKDNLFKGRALDSLIRRMAYATDLYTHLAMRCRKVGVKDKLPFKKLIADLRDSLVSEVEGIAKDSEALLALNDSALVESGSIQGAELVAWIDGNVRRIASDMDVFVVKPRSEVGPVFKYSLVVSRTLAARSGESAVSGSAGFDDKAKAAIDELVKAYTVFADFFAGDYLAEEEAKSPWLTKAVAKAYAKFVRAVPLAK